MHLARLRGALLPARLSGAFKGGPRRLLLRGAELYKPRFFTGAPKASGLELGARAGRTAHEKKLPGCSLWPSSKGPRKIPQPSQRFRHVTS